MKLTTLKIVLKKIRFNSLLILIPAAILFSSKPSFSQQTNAAAKTIEVGVARVDITPDMPIRLTGYAARAETEADSVLQRLSAKALVLGSDEQKPTVIITVDLVGITWRITRQVVKFLSEKYGIDSAQIAICASHTHGGPEIGSLINILQYHGNHFSDSLLPLNQLIHIAQYTEQLTQKLKDVAVAALKDRKPAYVSWGQGQAQFAGNRRTKGGPVDHALPILKITNPDGSLRAVFVNYACHGTTLGGNVNKIHGDWIVAAKHIIEARHPGTMALIALGCAGDANPYPRGTIEDMESHGKEIADNVDKLLTAQLQPITAPPVGEMKWVKLPLTKRPSVPELINLSKGNTVKAYQARLTLEQVERGKEIPSTVDYPIQVWNFGNKMVMVNLGGEVVVDYSILLKDKYGAEHLWINAYSNHVPCYIPSRRILKEGGYEGESNMYWYDKPSRFAPQVQDMITNAVDDLMPAAFKVERPAANQQELIEQGEDGVYQLSSWLAGTVGNDIKYMPEWKAFGWFNTPDQASWKVSIAKKGRYDVYLVYSVSDQDAGKAFVLQLGKKRLKGKVEKTGSWFTYKRKKIGSVRLSSGVHTITLKSGSRKDKGSMFDLREVTLVPAG
ncbi:MAG TPA: neutral/alkaline non-lysosomal ceramidase N-terminal domain-containing protein [Chitinophagaceae bacterium]|nr:neutral/alkaline non-lysosomal ceramidase N-terminal domain-containing protein [Chitinophagaceae bacterium]